MIPGTKKGRVVTTRPVWSRYPDRGPVILYGSKVTLAPAPPVQVVSIWLPEQLML